MFSNLPKVSAFRFSNIFLVFESILLISFVDLVYFVYFVYSVCCIFLFGIFCFYHAVGWCTWLARGRLSWQDVVLRASASQHRISVFEVAARRGFSSSLNPYTTLGLSREASEEEIKKAYREQALRFGVLHI